MSTADRRDGPVRYPGEPRELEGRAWEGMQRKIENADAVARLKERASRAPDLIRNPSVVQQQSGISRLADQLGLRDIPEESVVNSARARQRLTIRRLWLLALALTQHVIDPFADQRIDRCVFGRG